MAVAREAQRYMASKGYPSVRPFGMLNIAEDSCWYFYYLFENPATPGSMDLMELEVADDTDFDRPYRCTVTCFRPDVA